MLKLYITLLSLIFAVSFANASVVVNEIMASNRFFLADEDGDYPDWIELYNKGDSAINLRGYYISDKDSNRFLWEFPDVIINPRSYLLIFASGKNRIGENGENLHTSFSISKHGEPIILSCPDGKIIDRLPPAFVETNYSYGRMPDGGKDIVLFKTPTPLKENSGQHTKPLDVELSFSHKSGFYMHEFLLSISSEAKAGSFNIKYTVDATNPVDSGMIYSSPLRINSREGEENVFAQIPSAIPEYWREPKDEIDKIWVVRARPVRNGIPLGSEIAGSFWIGHHNPKSNNLPVVSLISSPDDLFGYENGIYVPGINYDEEGRGNFYLKGRENERETFFMYFDETGDLILDQKAGLRIHGNATRRYRQKSMRLYARSSYGKEYFEHDFFEDRENDKFKRLLLASTMRDDMSKTLIKDELCTYLVRNLDIDYLAFSPVIVFLNGEYWGIHYLKERRDNYYIAQNNDVDVDGIDRLHNNMIVKSGSDSHYQYLLDFLFSADPLDPETYNIIKGLMDIDNYIDYMTMQIYMQNRDWPHNNVEYWRPHEAGGRWRWIFWDLDRALEQYFRDNISMYFDSDFYSHSHRKLQYLLRIPEFKTKFIDRFYYHVKYTLTTEQFFEALDYLDELIRPHISNHIKRWRVPYTVYEWEQNVKDIKTFASLRPAAVISILNQNKVNPFTIYPNPAKDIIYVYHNETFSENSDIIIYNAIGQKINTAGLIISTVPYLSINIRGLKQGVYHLKIVNRGLVYTNSFIKI